MTYFARRQPCLPPPTLQNIDHHVANLRVRLLRRQELIQDLTANSEDVQQEVGPHLLDWIAETGNLRSAWDHLASEGGQAPGPNGMTYLDFAKNEVWQLLRELSRTVSDGSYQPGPERRVQIPKGAGRGFRTLTLQNLQDRVVARGAQQILEPLIRPRLAHTKGHCQSAPDRRRLFALVERYVCNEGLEYLVKCDIANAFDSVPIGRLAQLLPNYIPSPEVVQLVTSCIGSPCSPGLRQGSPLSPLLLDVYLDHFLEKPWQRRNTTVPLLRYADDILALCQSSEAADATGAEIERLIRNAGMRLKETGSGAVTELFVGNSTEWLGMNMFRDADSLMYSPSDTGWQHLKERLSEVQSSPSPATVARLVIQGWAEQQLPMRNPDEEEFWMRVNEVAIACGFERACNGRIAG